MDANEPAPVYHQQQYAKAAQRATELNTHSPNQKDIALPLAKSLAALPEFTKNTLFNGSSRQHKMEPANGKRSVVLHPLVY